MASPRQSYCRVRRLTAEAIPERKAESGRS
jgi:hypothetical protein